MKAIRSKAESRRGAVPLPSMNPPAHDKLSRLKKRDYIVGNSDDFVHMDWSGEWSELKNLEPLPDRRGSDSVLGKTSWPKSRKPTKNGANT
jgi:hypothetical protein